MSFDCVRIQEIKKEFIDQCEDYLKPQYKKLFGRHYGLEVSIQKDIYEFDLNQLKGLFLFESANTDINHLIKIKNLLKNYIDWAIKEGLTNSNLNPLTHIENEWLEQFSNNFSNVES